MLKPMRIALHVRGFSLVEVMVAMALLTLLLGLAAPSFTVWTRNAQVRTVSDALQSGLRLAQGEAVRRNRQVVFFRTDSRACTNDIDASDDGAFWSIRTVPLMAGEESVVVQCGVLNDIAADVTVAGPAALCFNSGGRQVANDEPGIDGADCELDPSGTSTFDIQITAGDRPLRVTVSLGGQVRMCDPARQLGAGNSDGCPA